MPKIFIVVTATLVCAAIGMVGTGEILVQLQKNQRSYQPPLDAMKEAADPMTPASPGLNDRQTSAIIGAGVGAAIGLVGSLLFLWWRDRRKGLATASPGSEP